MGNIKKNDSSFWDMVVYAMMIAAVIFVVVESILANNAKLHFKIILGIWVLVAVTVADFVGPMVTGKVVLKGEKPALLYTIYAIADAFAYMGLYIFIINVGYTREPWHYVFLGLAVVMFIAKTFLYGKYRSETVRYTREVVREVEENDDIDDFEVDNLSLDDEDDFGLKEIIYREKNRK